MNIRYGFVQVKDAIILLYSKCCDATSAVLLNLMGYFEGGSRQSDVGDPVES